MQQTLFEMPGVDDRIAHAVNLIRAVGKHAPLMVSFSGGKDSIVLD